MKKVYWLSALVFVGITIGLLYLPTLRWLWNEWFRTGVRFYSHGSLVLLISFLLVWRKRWVFASAHHWLKGSLLVLLGLGLGIVVRLHNLPLLYTHSFSAYSFITLTIGLVLLLFGKKVVRQLLFPLLFLVLAIPLPFTGQLASFLAKMVATASVALAGAAGIAVAREGTIVVVGGYSYSIDPLCSSLNIMLALFTLVLPVLYLKRYSWVKCTAFLLATPVVALVFKILLVTSIFWMTQKGGYEVAIQAYHGWAGMLAFGISLLTILLPILLFVRPKLRPLAEAIS